jgi:hypothetical protein
MAKVTKTETYVLELSYEEAYKLKQYLDSYGKNDDIAQIWRALAAELAR